VLMCGSEHLIKFLNHIQIVQIAKAAKIRTGHPPPSRPLVAEAIWQGSAYPSHPPTPKSQGNPL